MMKKYAVNILKIEADVPYIDFTFRDDDEHVGVKDIVKVLEEEFAYKIDYKVDGYATIIWRLKSGEKEIVVIYDPAFGVEIRPDNREAESDLSKMDVFYKEIFEILPDDGPPIDNEEDDDD